MEKPLDFIFNQTVFWYSRRESNPQLTLRRGLLSPFNYGSIFNFSDTSQLSKIEKYPCGCKKDVISSAVNRFVYENQPETAFLLPICSELFGQSNPLGGVCYIHLTTEAQIKVALNKRPSSTILKSININFIFLTHHRQSVNSFKSKMSIQIFLSFKLYHTQTRYRRFLDSCRGVRDNDRRRKENIRKRYSEVGQGSALQVSDEINAHFAEQTLSNKNIQIKRNPCHAVGQ